MTSGVQRSKTSTCPSTASKKGTSTTNKSAEVKSRDDRHPKKALMQSLRAWCGLLPTKTRQSNGQRQSNRRAHLPSNGRPQSSLKSKRCTMMTGRSPPWPNKQLSLKRRKSLLPGGRSQLRSLLKRRRSLPSRLRGQLRRRLSSAEGPTWRP